MKTELRQLIEAYQTKAAELIPRLSKALGFNLPVNNSEWAGLDIPHRGKTPDGLEYFKHGYGVAIKYEGGVIDVDFGDKGEYDGFDAWRIFRFAEESKLSTPYVEHRQVESDMKEAEASGELRFSGYILYYVSNGR
jgi:hypothetical protein